MEKIFYFLISLFSAYAWAGSSLPEPYASIQLLPEYPFGWYSNAQAIETLFKKQEIRVVIEVGSWLGGGSTRHFGNLLKLKKGVLYSVDTWLGSSTQQIGREHYQPILGQAYEQFLSNMIHWGLTETVVPIRMESLLAAQTLEVHPDLIYIDAEHTTEAVYADLCAWYPLLKENGIFCGDDWGWPSVREAVEQFAKENGMKIRASGNFWLLE